MGVMRKGNRKWEKRPERKEDMANSKVALEIF